MSAWLKIGEYEVATKSEDILGHGEFGTHFTGRHVTTKQKVAVKKVANSTSEDASGEIKILYKLKPHPNIVHLLEFVYLGTDLWLIFQMSEVSDLNCYFKMGPRDFSTKLDIARQVTSAVAYLHGQKDKPIIHRRIKPGYILPSTRTSANVVVKLTGFARSDFYTGPEKTTITLNEYKAPECFDSGDWTLATDVFSLGLVILAMIINDVNSDTLYPYSVEALADKRKCIIGHEMLLSKQKQLTEPTVIDVNIGGPGERVLRSLVHKMTCLNPEERITAAECENCITELVNKAADTSSLEATSEP